jgi:multicomponent Na+:H+ antiporter subunit G
VTIVAVALITAGLFFLGVSAFGLVRFPDFYTRAHVVAKSETLGMILVIGGVMVHHGFGSGTWRLALLLLFAMVANPTAIHALARAYHLQQALGSPDAEGEPVPPDPVERRAETGQPADPAERRPGERHR